MPNFKDGFKTTPRAKTKNRTFISVNYKDGRNNFHVRAVGQLHV